MQCEPAAHPRDEWHIEGRRQKASRIEWTSKSRTANRIHNLPTQSPKLHAPAYLNTLSASPFDFCDFVFEPQLPSLSAFENAQNAISELGHLTEASVGKCSGKLLLKGTRFSVAQLIAELTDDGESLRSICDNYDLDFELAKEILHAISAGFNANVA